MKIVYLIVIILLVALGVYLNRSYAYIYQEIGSVGLSSPDTKRTYTTAGTGEDKTAPILYVALGDSLTAGVGTNNFQQSYPYLVAEKLANSGSAVTLKDLSVSGAKTSELISYQLAEEIFGMKMGISLFKKGGINGRQRRFQACRVKNWAPAIPGYRLSWHNRR